MLPIVVSIIFSIIPVVFILTSFQGMTTGMSEKEYKEVAIKKAISIYQSTGSIPSSVAVFGRNVSINPQDVDLTDSTTTTYKEILHKKANLEQLIINTCINIYVACGKDSRMQPVYNGIRYSNLASNYYVTVSPDKNGYLSFHTTHSGGGNAYTYYGIWSGSYTISPGDTLIYDVFAPFGIPTGVGVGGIEFDFQDGTFMRHFNVRDQNNLHSTFVDITPYIGKWYRRIINLQNVVGKTISYISVVTDADVAGAYNGVLYKNMQIINNTTSKLKIWDPSFLYAFLDLPVGKISDLVSGTTLSSINCATATEPEFAAYGRYLLKQAISSQMYQPVSINGIIREFYYSKPTGGGGCQYSDIVDLR